jgi:hypothetical protein
MTLPVYLTLIDKVRRTGQRDVYLLRLHLRGRLGQRGYVHRQVIRALRIAEIKGHCLWALGLIAPALPSRHGPLQRSLCVACDLRRRYGVSHVGDSSCYLTVIYTA